MQMETTIRICTTCTKPLPWSNTESGQKGWLCCDEYYCSEDCLDKSFDSPDLPDDVREGGWEDHFTEDGNCYYTEWEIEEVE